MLTKNELGLLGLSETPPTNLEFTDKWSEEWKRECLAWSLIKRRYRNEIDAYLEKVKETHGEDFYNDMWDRLNKLRHIVKARRQAINIAEGYRN